MDYEKTIEWLEEVLEERGGRVPLAEFSNLLAREFNIIDRGAIKRKLTSLEQLKLISINPYNRLVFISQQENGKIGVI